MYPLPFGPGSSRNSVICLLSVVDSSLFIKISVLPLTAEPAKLLSGKIVKKFVSSPFRIAEVTGKNLSPV